MRTIFVSIYDGDTEKVILHSGVVDRLVSAGCRVILLVRGPDRLEYYRKTYGAEQVLVELSPPSRSRAEMVWHEVSWNSVPTRGAYLRQRIAYVRSGKVVPYLARRIFSLLARSRLWREFLRLVYALSPDNYAAELFEQFKPDAVFAPNMFSPSDFRLLRAAKRRGIPTVTMVKSWDVLTTKAFTRVKADRILALNERTALEAVQYGDYPKERVIITGFPQFDPYSRPPNTSREDFCRSLGLDPTKKIIVFAVPGDVFAPHTHEVLAHLDRFITQRALPVQILARLHPKYRAKSETLVLANGVIERPGTLVSGSEEAFAKGGDLFAWTFSKNDSGHLINSLQHADLVIFTFSTLILDTLAAGKPGIAVGYDGDAKVQYWKSIRRQYDREYYQHVLSFGAIPLVESHGALTEEVVRMLADPTFRITEREAATRALVKGCAGHAAQSVAEAIVNIYK